MRFHQEEYKERSKLPLKASLIKEERDDLVLKWLSIDSGLDQSIPAFIAKVKDVEPRGLLLFLHGLGGRKEDVLELKVIAGRFSLCMLAIDARGHGDRVSSITELSAYEMLAEISGTIVDNRLALDIAMRENLAKGGETILIGSSMGGIIGSIVAGVDGRISGTILYVAGGGLDEILMESKHDMVSRFRGKIQPALLMAMKPLMADVEPLNFVDKISPRPLLIQLGRFDDFVPFKNGMKLYEKAKEPKQLVVHESGHELPRENALLETIKWIEKNFPYLSR